MGCGSNKQPVQPATPTVGGSVNDVTSNWASLLPLIQSQMQAQSNAYKDIAPISWGLREQAAAQLRDKVGQSPDEWYTKNVRDTMASNFGSNIAYNPAGQEAFGLGTNQAYKDWNDYYTNAAMGAATPLPQAMDVWSAFNPQTTMGFNANTYGTQADMYNNAQNLYYQQQNKQAMYPFMAMQSIGNAAQGIGSIFNPAAQAGNVAKNVTGQFDPTKAQSWYDMFKGW